MAGITLTLIAAFKVQRPLTTDLIVRVVFTFVTRTTETTEDGVA